jgi:hypothetical protein
MAAAITVRGRVVSYELGEGADSTAGFGGASFRRCYRLPAACRLAAALNGLDRSGTRTGNDTNGGKEATGRNPKTRMKSDTPEGK